MGTSRETDEQAVARTLNTAMQQRHSNNMSIRCWKADSPFVTDIARLLRDLRERCAGVAGECCDWVHRVSLVRDAEPVGEEKDWIAEARKTPPPCACDGERTCGFHLHLAEKLQEKARSIEVTETDRKVAEAFNKFLWIPLPRAREVSSPLCHPPHQIWKGSNMNVQELIAKLEGSMIYLPVLVETPGGETPFDVEVRSDAIVIRPLMTVAKDHA